LTQGLKRLRTRAGGIAHPRTAATTDRAAPQEGPVRWAATDADHSMCRSLLGNYPATWNERIDDAASALGDALQLGERDRFVELRHQATSRSCTTHGSRADKLNVSEYPHVIGRPVNVPCFEQDDVETPMLVRIGRVWEPSRLRPATARPEG
jgi:hypothetical protein